MDKPRCYERLIVGSSPARETGPDLMIGALIHVRDDLTCVKSNGGKVREERQQRFPAFFTEKNTNNTTSTTEINVVDVESGKMRNKIEDLL